LNWFGRQKNFFLLIWLIFLGGCIVGLVAQFHYHKFLNIDTLSYINIGELYASGKLNLAINGCWSPLYSWIIALLSLVHVPPLATCYVLNFVSAACCFNYLLKLSSRYLTYLPLQLLFYAFILFYLLNQALSALTPDLLATAIGCYFLWLLIADDFMHSRQKQVLAGIVGAFFYFSKSYNFLFVTGFLLLLLLISFTGTFKVSARKQRVAYLITLLVFLMVSTLWIIPLSKHENAITFSTSGPYVYHMVHPDNIDHPASSRIIAPPFPEAYSAWIDPVHHLDSMRWSPFQSKRFFDHQLVLVGSSFKEWIRILDAHYLKIAIIVFIILLSSHKPEIKRSITSKDLNVPGFVAFTYPLAYLPIFIFERYILLSVLFFHLLFFYFLQALAIFLNHSWRKVLMVVMVVIFINFASQYTLHTGIQKLYEYENYQAVYERKNEYSFLKNKKIASTKSCQVLSAQLSYWYKTRFYGIWNERDIDLVKAYGIEYVLASDVILSPALKLEKTITIRGYPVLIYRSQ